MKVHETDESNVGELQDLQAKSLIKENLTESDQITNGGGGNQLRMIVTPMLVKEIISF